MGSKLALVLGTAMAFIITVLVLLRVLPGPHKSADYLVIGTVATFVCLLALFVVVVLTGNMSNVLFKRRK